MKKLSWFPILWVSACLCPWIPARPANPALPATYYFFDDLESGSGKWVLDSPWAVSTEASFSGSNALTDSPGGSYAANGNISARFATPVNLSAAQKPMLSFWNKYAFEANNDFGYVEVSKDGGSTWTALFYATGSQSAWKQEQIDLAEYAGFSVLLRFRTATNYATNYDGWTIDDVSVEESTIALSYPFYDDLEGGTSNWLTSSWTIASSGHSGSNSLTVSSIAGNWNLTTAGTISLVGAKSPQLFFWYKHTNCYFYVDGSDNYGQSGSWIQLWSGSWDASWHVGQVDLSRYTGLDNVRIRFRPYACGNCFQTYVDDIRVENSVSPHPAMYTPTGVTMHGAHLSWQKYDPATMGSLAFTAAEGAAAPAFAAFDHYEIYRILNGNTTPVLVTKITDINQTAYDDIYTVLQPNVWHYRLYVVDANGLFSVGSTPVQAIYTVPLASYPFFDSLESGTSRWEWGYPWGLVTDSSHSATHAWADSPGGSYGSSVDTALTTSISLVTATKPVLSFWNKYALETYYDLGYVEVSKDGGTSWTRLFYANGFQTDWKQVQIDLSEFVGSTAIIRFRLTTNATVNYDGWTIDDIRVEESTTTVSYPFFDDLESGSANWLASSWAIASPGHSGNNSLMLAAQQSGMYSYLTTAGTVSLIGAKNPQLLFWYKGTMVYVEGSDNYGQSGSWSTLWTGGSTAWQAAQVDLTKYTGLANVRIRFRDHNCAGCGQLSVDDIRIENSVSPHPAMYLPTGVTMHGAHLSWQKYDPATMGSLALNRSEGAAAPRFAAFDHYEIYRILNGNTTPVLVAKISDINQTAYDDTYAVLQPNTWYYKFYVVDTNGISSLGSAAVQAAYTVPTVGYPFFDDMEYGTANWEWGAPWGRITDFSHSPVHAWTDSPGGNYGSSVDTSWTTSISLAAATRPLLSFRHKYALEANKDVGYVEVSKDGGITWTDLFFATGIQPDWNQARIDLTEYVGFTVVLRFRIVTDSLNHYDGWTIDDVRIEESTAAIPYPFFDDLESGTANWLTSSWKPDSPGYTGNNSLTATSHIGSGSGYYSNLTSAGTFSLAGAKNPQLFFWYKTNYQLVVDISNSYGQPGTWSQVWYGSSTSWQAAQVNLNAYAGLANVRIRFRPGVSVNSWAYTFSVDDIALGDSGTTYAAISATDDSAAEAGLTTGTFTVSRFGGATTSPLTVNYSVGGTATAGSDYTALPGSVTIPADQASATVPVAPLQDTAAEGSETVTVNLTSNANYTIGNPGSATVTILDDEVNNNPVPTVTSISPPFATAGGGAFALTVNGTNFTAGSLVRWNGQDRATTYVSAARLTASIPSSDLAASGTAAVTVFNPTPGGGTSNAQSFTINVAANPLPTLSTISPTSALTGGNGFTLTVDGTNFLTGSVVRWNGADRATVFVNSTRLTAAILSADVAAGGTAGITVFNPAPGGGTSNSRAFTVNAANPVPTTTSLLPAEISFGSGTFSLTVFGTNFVNGSVVLWNGQVRSTAFVSAAQLTAVILAGDIAASGTAAVTVYNTSPGGGTSNAKTFTIQATNPTPIVSGATPLSATSGGSSFTLTVSGTGFVLNSAVRWNGTNRSTTYLNSMQLAASISSADVASAGFPAVTVYSPAPGGGLSNVLTFTVVAANPGPATLSLSPSSATKGDPAFPLTVNGSSFVKGAVVRWNGSNRTTTFVSDTQLSAAVLVEDIASVGTAAVTVFNPAPGGGLSNTQSFTIKEAASSVSPLAVTKVYPNMGLDSVPNEIVLTGTGFLDGAVAAVAGATRMPAGSSPVLEWIALDSLAVSPESPLGDLLLRTSFVSTSELRAVVPLGLRPGVYALSVVNPNGHQTSLTGAYTVLDHSVAGYDDLYGNDYELWTSPATPRAGLPGEIGLIIHRKGGQSTLNNIAIRFRLGDCTTGTLLGDGSVTALSPDGTGSTAAVSWIPPFSGEASVCATIDPGLLVQESRKDNNRIVRTVRVWPQPPDQTPPQLDSFTVNKGVVATTNRSVKLDVTASDPQPSPSGVVSVFFQEFEFHQEANAWIPVQQSEWQAYPQSSSDFAWRLVPFVGLHHLQAWAMDKAGNVSLFPYKAMINYLPPADTIRRQQLRLYRQTLKVNQILTAILTPISGDPDLYVWAPDSDTRPPWVSNRSAGVDQLVIKAPREGVYQLEVHGNTASQYRLEIDVKDTPTAENPGTTDKDKIVKAAPLVAPGNDPSNHIATPSGQTTVVSHQLWLPLIVR